MNSDSSRVLKIEIETSGAAFDEGPEVETARILRKLATDIEQGNIEDNDIPTALRDINGNTIGTVWIEEED